MPTCYHPRPPRVRVLQPAVPDLYTWSGKDPEASADSGMWPMILGHEGAGIVESVGPDVTSVKPGDLVVLLYIPECRECKYCKSGKTNLCRVIRSTQGKGLMPDGTTRFSTMDHKPIRHFKGCSAFSTYTVVADISLAVMPGALTERADRLCLLGCGVTTGWGSTIKTGNVQPGDKVAVWGCGTVGLAAMAGARHAGAEMVIAVDNNPAKEEIARDFGATHFVLSSDTTKEDVIELTDGGADVTVEAVGRVSLMNDALMAAHPGWGKSVVVGVAGSGEKISYAPFNLVLGRVHTGCAFGGVKGRSELPGMAEAWASDELPLRLDDYVSSTHTLAAIGDAVHEAHSGKALRPVIYMDAEYGASRSK